MVRCQQPWWRCHRRWHLSHWAHYRDSFKSRVAASLTSWGNHWFPGMWIHICDQRVQLWQTWHFRWSSRVLFPIEYEIASRVHVETFPLRVLKSAKGAIRLYLGFLGIPLKSSRRLDDLLSWRYHLQRKLTITTKKYFIYNLHLFKYFYNTLNLLTHTDTRPGYVHHPCEFRNAYAFTSLYEYPRRVSLLHSRLRVSVQ